jgi:hypothetical protein
MNGDSLPEQPREVDVRVLAREVDNELERLAEGFVTAKRHEEEGVGTEGRIDCDRKRFRHGSDLGKWKGASKAKS